MAIIERGRKARGNSATFAIVELRGYGATFWVSDYGALTCPTPAAAHGCCTTAKVAPAPLLPGLSYKTGS